MFIELHKKKGFSIIEMLVVLTTLLFILIALLVVFGRLIKTRKRVQLLAGIQQNAKMAEMVLSNTLQSTGYLMLKDIGIFPDPACTLDTSNPFCAVASNRVRDTDGFIAFVPSIDNPPLLKPYDDQNNTCYKAIDSCPTTTQGKNGCFLEQGSSNTVRVCSPSGGADNEWNNTQMMLCGPIPAGTDCTGGISIPQAYLPTPTNLDQQGFQGWCGAVNADYCCIPVTVRNGPVCPGGNRANGLQTSACSTGYETITFNQQINVSFADGSFARCQILVFAEAIHFQIHELNDTTSPTGKRRFLMMDRNFQNTWAPIAQDVYDMKICYEMNTVTCDAQSPAQPGPAGMGCIRWNWDRSRLNVTCQRSDNARLITIRDIERARIQLSLRNALPYFYIGRSVTGSQQCDQNLPAPPALPPDARNWRQITTCTTVFLRNIVLSQIFSWL